MLVAESYAERKANIAVAIVFDHIKNFDGTPVNNVDELDDWEVQTKVGFDDRQRDPIRFNAMTDEDCVTLDVSLGPTFGPDHYEQTYHKLRSVLRHEYEHSLQLKRGDAEPGYDPDNALSGDPNEMLRYLTDPNEIEAFVSDVYLNAKKTRRPFKVAFNDRITPFARKMLNSGVDKRMVIATLAKVKRSWFTYAAGRYPAAMIA